MPSSGYAETEDDDGNDELEYDQSYVFQAKGCPPRAPLSAPVAWNIVGSHSAASICAAYDICCFCE